MTNSALAGLRALAPRGTNGTGNNEENEGLGAVGQVFTRVAQNSYTDGIELMERARPLDWDPAGTLVDNGLAPPRPVFVNNPDDEVAQGRAGPDLAVDIAGQPLDAGDLGSPGVFERDDGSLFRIPLTDDLRFVNQPTGDLPQARDVSNALFAQPQDAAGNDVPRPNAFGTNDFHLFFGQALTHDMVETQVNVTAVSIAASTGIGWAGGDAQGDAAPDITGAVLVRVDPATGQALRDAMGQPVRLFAPGTPLEEQIAALRAGTLDLPDLMVPGPQPGTTVTIPAVTAAQQQQAAEALVNHQALSLGAPFALQRTPGVYQDLDGDGTAERQQANTETAFLDLGNVYGKLVHAVVAANTVDLGNPAVVAWEFVLDGDGNRVQANGVDQVRLTLDTSVLLRRKEADGEVGGFLLTSDDVTSPRNGDDLLPTYGEVNPSTRLFADDAATAADEITTNMGRVFDPTLENFFSLDRYAAGDQRVNQNAATVTQQTVWMRNHNWHAEQLSRMFPDWTGEEIFQAARALNEADYQKAVHDEYLPTLIGEAGMAMLGAYGGYDPAANPAVINEWTTIAFRFGHDQSSNFVSKLREDGSISERVLLIESFTRAGAGAGASVKDAAELDEWLRGQLAATHEAIDGFVVEGNRGELFGVTVSPVTGQPVVNDLTVFDITRGRDHGVNSYVKLREALGLDDYIDEAAGEDGTAGHGGAAAFDRWAADNDVSAERLAAAEELYGSDFTKLDAYVGVLLEKPHADSQVGITSTMLIALQFAATRDGDRFWYENRFADLPELLAMVEQGSMAQVLERTTGIGHVYREAFLAHERIGGTEGEDELRGTAGRDLLIGFGGDDDLRGGDGNDDLHGDAGDDVLRGGRGEDLILGGTGRDVMDGGAGADTLRGGDGRDVARGGRGDDVIEGGAGRDSVNGGQGQDTLLGGVGRDDMAGGAGDDLLDGGAGGDILLGGTGDDIFRFAPPDDGRKDRDRVLDFDLSGNDRIVLDVDDPARADAYAVTVRGFDVRISTDAGDEIILAGARFRFDLGNPSSEIELI